MNFYSVDELDIGTSEICKNILSDGEAVIMDDGRPAFLMLDIGDYDYELIVGAVRRAKAAAALKNMRGIAAESGYMTNEEIESEITAARRERRNREVRN